jgi:hypothetical protein
MWDDIAAPQLLLLINGILLPFIETLQTSVAPYFDSEFNSPIRALRSLILAIPILMVICIVGIASWFFSKRVCVSVLIVVNAFLLILYVVFSGILLVYSTFLESSMLSFDEEFRFNHGSTIPNMLYEFFRCPADTVGSSTNFSDFTSGSESVLDSVMRRMSDSLIGEIYEASSKIVEPITYFAIADRLPYYAIPDSEFDSLLSRSIVTDSAIPPFQSLYNANPLVTETNLIQSHAELDPAFASAYNAVFGPGRPCDGFRLPDLGSCPVGNNSDVVFLLQLEMVRMLRENASRVQDALREFSREGAISQGEFALLNLMSLIVKSYLYQISNALAATYAAVSKVYNGYSDFVTGPESEFQQKYTELRRITAGSCRRLNEAYNGFRGQIMFTLPERASVLFLLLFLTLALSGLLSIFVLVYKAETRNRWYDHSEYSENSGYSYLSYTTSSDTTFFDGKSRHNEARSGSSSRGEVMSIPRPSLPVEMIEPNNDGVSETDTLDQDRSNDE